MRKKDKQTPIIQKAADTEINLRILATTDLHACLTPWDYTTLRSADGVGLSRTATLIAQSRSEVENSLLLDNGDFLTGPGIGDFLVQDISAGQTNPMIAAMNSLGYDAVNIGNHEFSGGLDHLANAIKDAAFPVVNTNFDFKGLGFIQNTVLLYREFRDQNGRCHRLAVGIIGLLPNQTLIWEAKHLKGLAKAHPMIWRAKLAAQQLRAQGADIVIALAHTGAGTTGPEAQEDDCAQHIAEIAEIDAVIAGHSHRVFPQEHDTATKVPIVLPGSFGSHLGVIDLTLRASPQGWIKTAHRAQLRAVAARDPSTGRLSPVVADAENIIHLSSAVHRKILHQAQAVIGETPQRLHSYFATLTSSAAMTQIAAAQAYALSAALQGSSYGDLPMLSAVAPFKAGGRGGPENYTDVPTGVLRQHHLADLYIHANTLVGFRVTGADIAMWLERSVSKYLQIGADRAETALLDYSFPGFNCDMIFGVTYAIDLAQPPMFDTYGRVINPNTKRISDLRFANQPIDLRQEFVLASNSFRLEGHLGFAGTTHDHVIHDKHTLIRDHLGQFVAMGRAAPQANPAHWRFLPMPGATALFFTNPKSTEILDEIAHLRPIPLAVNADGFQVLRLQF